VGGRGHRHRQLPRSRTPMTSRTCAAPWGPAS
jgi:hypothetical protein